MTGPSLEPRRYPDGGPQLVHAPEVYRSQLSRLCAACDIEKRKLAYSGRLAAHPEQPPFDTALTAWVQAGKQSFFATKDLTAALDDTDLRDAPTDALQMPYDAFWIEPIPDFLTGEEVPASGEWASGDLPGAAGSRVALDAAAFRPERRLGLLVLHEVSSERRLLWAFVVHEPDRETVATYRQCIIFGKPTLRDSLDSAISEMRYHEAMGDCVGKWPGEPTNQRSTMSDAGVRRLFTYIVNFCLYLSTPDPDLREVTPPAVVRGPASGSPDARREWRRRVAEAKEKGGKSWLVGAKLTYLRESRGRADASEPTGRHPRRHLVRGFWRHQPYGPERSARRLQWVRPHWRGQEEPGYAERTYVAKPGKKEGSGS